jgi:hypothetical protein
MYQHNASISLIHQCQLSSHVPAFLGAALWVNWCIVLHEEADTTRGRSAGGGVLALIGTKGAKIGLTRLRGVERGQVNLKCAAMY